MRKEIIVAILIGILFGGIFTYGIRRANFALKPAPNDTNSTNGSVGEEAETEPVFADSLTIHLPEQYDVFTTDSVTITGITKPNSTVIISAEDEDFVFTSKASGEFSQVISLTPGINKVLVSSFTDQISIGNEELNLVYTTQIDI